MTSITTVTLELATGGEITADHIAMAAKLFSENYGIWPNGDRVKMSPRKLRQMLLPEGPRAVHCLVRASANDEVIGHVFATRWIFENRGLQEEGGQVCWITQLVVRKDYRRQRIATDMLRKLRESGGRKDWACGILSSHPAAIMAALRAFGLSLQGLDLKFTTRLGKQILLSSPVEYVSTARAFGEVFGDEGTVSSAFTNFGVDHAEPDEVLATILEEKRKWPLGRLLPGHEYLVTISASEFSPNTGG